MPKLSDTNLQESSDEEDSQVPGAGGSRVGLFGVAAMLGAMAGQISTPENVGANIKSSSGDGSRKNPMPEKCAPQQPAPAPGSRAGLFGVAAMLGSVTNSENEYNNAKPSNTRQNINSRPTHASTRISFTSGDVEKPDRNNRASGWGNKSNTWRSSATGSNMTALGVGSGPMKFPGGTAVARLPSIQKRPGSPSDGYASFKSVVDRGKPDAAPVSHLTKYNITVTGKDWNRNSNRPRHDLPRGNLFGIKSIGDDDDSAKKTAPKQATNTWGSWGSSKPEPEKPAIPALHRNAWPDDRVEDDSDDFEGNYRKKFGNKPKPEPFGGYGTKFGDVPEFRERPARGPPKKNFRNPATANSNWSNRYSSSKYEDQQDDAESGWAENKDSWENRSGGSKNRDNEYYNGGAGLLGMADSMALSNEEVDNENPWAAMLRSGNFDEPSQPDDSSAAPLEKKKKFGNDDSHGRDLFGKRRDFARDNGGWQSENKFGGRNRYEDNRNDRNNYYDESAGDEPELNEGAFVMDPRMARNPRYLKAVEDLKMFPQLSALIGVSEVLAAQSVKKLEKLSTTEFATLNAGLVMCKQDRMDPTPILAAYAHFLSRENFDQVASAGQTVQSVSGMFNRPLRMVEVERQLLFAADMANATKADNENVPVSTHKVVNLTDPENLKQGWTSSTVNDQATGSNDYQEWTGKPSDSDHLTRYEQSNVASAPSTYPPSSHGYTAESGYNAYHVPQPSSGVSSAASAYYQSAPAATSTQSYSGYYQASSAYQGWAGTTINSDPGTQPYYGYSTASYPPSYGYAAASADYNAYYYPSAVQASASTIAPSSAISATPVSYSAAVVQPQAATSAVVPSGIQATAVVSAAAVAPTAPTTASADVSTPAAATTSAPATWNTGAVAVASSHPIPASSFYPPPAQSGYQYPAQPQQQSNPYYNFYQSYMASYPQYQPGTVAPPLPPTPGYPYPYPAPPQAYPYPVASAYYPTQPPQTIDQPPPPPPSAI